MCVRAHCLYSTSRFETAKRRPRAQLGLRQTRLERCSASCWLRRRNSAAHNRGSFGGRPACRPGGAVPGQEVCKHGVPVLGEDALRVELDALHRPLGVPHALDDAPGRLAGDAQARWQGVALAGQAVVADGAKGRRHACSTRSTVGTAEQRKETEEMQACDETMGSQCTDTAGGQATPSPERQGSEGRAAHAPAKTPLPSWLIGDVLPCMISPACVTVPPNTSNMH